METSFNLSRSKIILPAIKVLTKQFHKLQNNITSPNLHSSFITGRTSFRTPRYSSTIKKCKYSLFKDRSDTEYDVEKIASLKLEQEKNNHKYQSKLQNLLKQIHGNTETYQNNTSRIEEQKQQLKDRQQVSLNVSKVSNDNSKRSRLNTTRKQKENKSRIKSSQKKNKKFIRVIHQNQLYQKMKVDDLYYDKIKKATQKAKEIHKIALLDNRLRDADKKIDNF